MKPFYGTIVSWINEKGTCIVIGSGVDEKIMAQVETGLM